MKQSCNFICLVLALLLVGTNLSAQLRVNPKVGVNFSGIDAKLNDINAEARVGWNAGIDFRFGKALFFNPGIHYYNYTARLLKDVDNPNDVDIREETTIRNLKIPVNIGLKLTGNDGLLQIYAKGGAAATYTLGVQEKNGFAFDKDSLKDWTFGANVGLGVDILFLTIDATYEIGLTDFFNDVEGKNNVFTLSAGLKF